MWPVCWSGVEEKENLPCPSLGGGNLSGLKMLGLRGSGRGALALSFISKADPPSPYLTLSSNHMRQAQGQATCAAMSCSTHASGYRHAANREVIYKIFIDWLARVPAATRLAA